MTETDPTAAEAREILTVSENALTDTGWITWLSQAKAGITLTSDRFALLYGACYLWATAKGWQYARSVGDRSFSDVKPEVFEKLYVNRCMQLNVAPELIRKAKGLLKINSAADDDEDLNA